jgi:spore photoproduct lyase
MRLYSEYQRLEDTKRALQDIRISLGPNKKQELIRLIYETSKRDCVIPSLLLKEAVGDNLLSPRKSFASIKDYLLRKRFSVACKDKKDHRFHFPKLILDAEYSVSKKKLSTFYPERIFIEKDAGDFSITKSILKRLPRSKHIKINSLKGYIKENNERKNQIRDYNERTKNLFLVKERYDFIKPCPCSKGVVGCGYYILNLGFGCIYECSYCFLQNYTNVNGIVIPVNIDDFLFRLEALFTKNPGSLRIGTGEFTDSLALDGLTGFSQILIEFFSRFENKTLELKTKSNNVEKILELRGRNNIVISWSLNPQFIVDSDEWQTCDLMERLEAAKKCCEAGYLVGFHFDPLIYSKKWKENYRELVDLLFKAVSYKNIAWISLGTFRFSPRLKTIIEQRFPDSRILDEELIIGFDKKLRYLEQLRIEIYKSMISWIRKYSDSVLVYLCMEPKDVWEGSLGRIKF